MEDLKSILNVETLIKNIELGGRSVDEITDKDILLLLSKTGDGKTTFICYAKG